MSGRTKKSGTPQANGSADSARVTGVLEARTITASSTALCGISGVREHRLIWVLQGYGAAKLHKSKVAVQASQLLWIMPERRFELALEPTKLRPTVSYVELVLTTEEQRFHDVPLVSLLADEDVRKELMLLLVQRSSARETRGTCKHPTDLQLAELLLRLAAMSYGGVRPLPTEQLPDAIVRALDFMSASDYGVNGAPPAMDAITKAARVSRSQLHRLFTRYLGAGPADVARRVRLERAARALRTGAAVRVAGEQAGFRDPFYFSRLFKKAYGVSPRDFRRQAVEGQEGPVMSPVSHDIYWLSWYHGAREMRREQYLIYYARNPALRRRLLARRNAGKS